MKLLIKFPTRGRKQIFFNVLDKYYEYLDDIDNTKFIISCDIDDVTMNNNEVINKFKEYKNLKFYYGQSKSKIEAVNSDLGEDEDYDIILLASDDMLPQIKGYDTIIKNDMEKYYPDTDGVLWYFDGYRKDLNTLSILGKKYFKRFNYIYNPEYKSFYADNEFMLVSNKLNKQKFLDLCIIKHDHPDINGREYDETYNKNNFSGDDTIFRNRYIKNFDLI